MKIIKPTRIVSITALLIFGLFTSCKKNYTCTCTTVVGAGSVDIRHSIDNAYYGDAKSTCNNYQDQANSSLPGGTTCHL